jgi:hypothetical protein
MFGKKKADDDSKDWKWMLAYIPAMGGEWMFQVRKEFIPLSTGQRGTITVRRICKLVTGMDKKTNLPAMSVQPWVPRNFGTPPIVDDLMEQQFDASKIFFWQEMENDCEMVGECLGAWIEKRITPADERMQKSAEKAADRSKKLKIVT